MAEFQSHNFASLIPDLSKIVEQAGIAIMNHYSEAKANVNYKSDNSPLTLADLQANQIITDSLSKLTPKIPIVTEEDTSNHSYSIRQHYSLFWLVDPLDGTKEFLKKNGEFTVNIALIQDEEPILGVVSVPAQKTLYYAARGKGAWKTESNSHGHSPVPIKVKSFDSKHTTVAVSRSHPSSALGLLLRQLTDPITIPTGSSLKFMMVAEGNADIYPRLAPTMEWDTGASQIIVEEAGGRVLRLSQQDLEEWSLGSDLCPGNNKAGTDLLSKIVQLPKMKYNKGSLLNSWFVAVSRS